VLCGETKQGARQVSSERSSVFDLSPAEKLRLVEDLWDDIAAHPDAVPVFGWQQRELESRKARLEAIPASAIGWEEIKRRVRENRAT